MNTKKGNICTIIAVFVLVMMLSCISSIFGTGCAVYAQDDGVYRKLVSLQEKFPDGKYWNHIVPESEAWKNCTDESYADSCTDVPYAVDGANVGAGSYDCNFFDGGWQCCGFAKKIFFDIFI